MYGRLFSQNYLDLAEAIRASDNAKVNEKLRILSQDYNLITAMQYGVEVVKVLVGNGADVSQVYDAHPFPIQLPLTFAAFKGYVDIARVLIEAKADVNAVYRGVTALTQSRNVEITRMLLAAGADANFKCPDDYNVLNHTIHTGQADSVEALLRAGANPDSGDLLNMNVQVAAPNGTTPRIKRSLLEAGADPDRPSKCPRRSFETPLLTALRTEDLESVCLLLFYGAKPDLESKYFLDKKAQFMLITTPNTTLSDIFTVMETPAKAESYLERFGHSCKRKLY